MTIPIRQDMEIFPQELVKKNNRILFILKKREDYNSNLHYNLSLSTGLYNSVSFLEKMLKDEGIENKLVVVNDNNDIDREVTAYRPTLVIVEALWVVPEKFYVLSKLHPSVKWMIRIHSNAPFLANEGMAMGWIGKYLDCPNMEIACNEFKIFEEIKLFAKHKNIIKNNVIYLPNFYPQEYKIKGFDRDKDTVDIGCFGAIRPLKNQLIQAMAAVRFAEHIGKKLRFHINADRIETKGEPVLRNFSEYFQHIPHELVNVGWLDRDHFLEVCAKMDIGMQVSFSETFNFVTADLLSQGVPVVGSDEIHWMSKIYTANPVNSKQIYNILNRIYAWPQLNVWVNQRLLTQYTNVTRDIWVEKYGV